MRIEISRGPDEKVTAVKVDPASYKAIQLFHTPGANSEEGRRVDEAIRKAVDAAPGPKHSTVYIIPVNDW